MADKEVAIAETQNDNSLVFAVDNEEARQHNATSSHEDTTFGLHSHSNGNTVHIPGTNETATQVDRPENDESLRGGKLQLSPLLGNLRSFSPSKYSQESTFSPIKYAPGSQNTITESTPSRHPQSYRYSGEDARELQAPQDTQVILSGPSEHVEETADTMVIDPSPRKHEAEQLDFGADTQVIGNGHSEDPSKLLGSPGAHKGQVQHRQLSELDDTQRIMPATQVDDNTQVIGRPTPEWVQTQPLSPIVDGSPKSDTVTSSPGRANESEYNEANTTMVVLSPVERDLEPTTQVLNTQEEEFSSLQQEYQAVDLGCKPVLSSSEKDDSSRTYSGRTNHNLSVISNDEKDEEINDVFYEDSLFKHKLGQAYPDDNDEDSELKPPSTNSSEHKTPTLRKAIWSQSSPQTSSREASLKKRTWSQSSSDLEDISQDVGSLDLEVFQRKLSGSDSAHEPFDESREHIHLPKKRRVKHIAATQSQPDYSKVITEEKSASLNFDDLENFHGVWAFFQFRYYPARIIDFVDSDHTLVEFYDWCQKEVKNSDLCVLDIRIGDSLRTFNTSSEFIVRKMAASSDSPFKCIRGFDTVYLLKKGKNNNVSGTETTVSISSCYMEPDDWAQHQSRFHLMHQQVDLIQRDLSYISPLLSQHGVGLSNRESTPSALELKNLSPRKAKKLGSTSAPASKTLTGNVFFITSMSPDRKRQLTKVIEAHDGLVFDLELGQLVNFDVSDSYHLKITSQRFTGIKFGAFLSDGYSRSAKYLQALALGWPILADAFVEQAIQHPDILANWQAFLLPAGHSSHTRTLKSQDVYHFRINLENGQDLNNQFGNNSTLMANTNFLIYRKKQEKQTLNMCDFILHAFGAQTLQAFDMDDHIVSHIRENSDMYFLVFDNNAKEIEKAYRQRSKSNRVEDQIEFGIVDWEWLVQCTISGYMWPPVANGVIATK